MPKRPAARRRQRQPPTTAARRDTSPFSGILLAIGALTLRLFYLWSIRDSPFVHNLQTNPERYHEWALLILSGHAPAPPFEQAPGYAYFVALIYGIAGLFSSIARRPEVVAAVQAVADTGTCFFIAFSARRFFGARPGLIAGILAALYGPFIYFSAEMLPASLFLLLATAGVATQLAERWLVAGVLWAIATLVHPEAVCALPVVAMLAGRCRGRRAVSKVLLPSVAAILFCVGINSAASGRLAPVATSGGLNFWLGNNPHADGVNPFVSGPLQPIADRVVNWSGKDSVVADRLFRVEALRFWREMPVSALALTWKKFRWTFSDRELPNTTDIEWQKSYSWVFTLRILPLSFGVILPLALAGFALRTPRTGDLILLLAWVLPALAASVVFFTNARFRLLLAPACIVLAASAVDQLLIRARRWRTHLARFAIASALALVGVWLAWSDSYGVWQYRVPEIDVNTGILEREAGHFPAAIAYLRRGLVATPDDAIGWVHLALALEQNGEDGAALQAYLDGLTNLPHDATILPMAEKFFDRHHLDRQEFTAFEQTESPQLRDAIAKALVRSLR